MPTSRPIYVVGAPSPERERTVASIPAPSIRTFDRPEAFLDGASSPEPGVVVFVLGAVEPGAVLSTVLDLGKGRGEWTPVLAEPGPDGPRLRTLSVGYGHDASAAVDRAEDRDPAALLELRRAVAEISRARHDINNPLTSGMAEVQLLLMDAPPTGELRESLETIQAQLRRIRDMVAALGHLRHREDG